MQYQHSWEKILEMLVTASQQTRGPLESKPYKLAGLSAHQLRIPLTLVPCSSFQSHPSLQSQLWINTTLILRAICAVGLNLDGQF